MYFPDIVQFYTAVQELLHLVRENAVCIYIKNNFDFVSQ